jgi:hypothetical protein
MRLAQIELRNRNRLQRRDWLNLLPPERDRRHRERQKDDGQAKPSLMHRFSVQDFGRKQRRD